MRELYQKGMSNAEIYWKNVRVQPKNKELFELDWVVISTHLKKSGILYLCVFLYIYIYSRNGNIFSINKCEKQTSPLDIMDPWFNIIKLWWLQVPKNGAVESQVSGWRCSLNKNILYSKLPVLLEFHPKHSRCHSAIWESCFKFSQKIWGQHYQIFPAPPEPKSNLFGSGDSFVLWWTLDPKRYLLLKSCETCQWSICFFSPMDFTTRCWWSNPFEQMLRSSSPNLGIKTKQISNHQTRTFRFQKPPKAVKNIGTNHRFLHQPQFFSGHKSWAIWPTPLEPTKKKNLPFHWNTDCLIRDPYNGLCNKQPVFHGSNPHVLLWGRIPYGYNPIQLYLYWLIIIPIQLASNYFIPQQKSP